MQSSHPVRTWAAGAAWTPNLAPAGASVASIRREREARADRIRAGVWKSLASLAEPGAYFPLVLLSRANVALVMGAAEDAAMRAMSPGAQALLRLRPYLGSSSRMVDAWRSVAAEYMLAVRGEQRTAAEVRRVLEPANRRLVAELTPLLRTEMLRAAGDLRAGSMDEYAVGRHFDRAASKRVEALPAVAPTVPRRDHAVPHRTTSAERIRALRADRGVPSAPDL